MGFVFFFRGACVFPEFCLDFVGGIFFGCFLWILFIFCGDCFLINRKLIDEVGYFDCMKFYNYFGDVDFGTRTRAFNFKSIVSKGASDGS